MSYVPEDGDIIEVDFEENAEGRIIRRHVLVLSPKVFQEALKISWVSPITFLKSRHLFQMDLPDTVRTFGTVKLEQLMAMDFEARNARFVEKVPAAFLSRCKTAAGRVLGF